MSSHHLLAIKVFYKCLKHPMYLSNSHTLIYKFAMTMSECIRLQRSETSLQVVLKEYNGCHSVHLNVSRFWLWYERPPSPYTFYSWPDSWLNQIVESSLELNPVGRSLQPSIEDFTCCIYGSLFNDVGFLGPHLVVAGEHQIKTPSHQLELFVLGEVVLSLMKVDLEAYLIEHRG